MLVALHVHSSYSACSESPVDKIAAYCRQHEIEAVSITDHNSIEGAMKLRDVAPDLGVIVGEEVSTHDGEVVGLFLKEKIEPGEGLRKSCEAIKAQGGLVYIPHPFDRFKVHRVRRHHLMEILDLVDIIEIYNAKISLGKYNKKARQFAETYHKAGAVGSDSHYIASIGSAVNIMEPFDDAQDFLEKLSRAEFRTGAGSLLSTWWVRARKLLKLR